MLRLAGTFLICPRRHACAHCKRADISTQYPERADADWAPQSCREIRC